MRALESRVELVELNGGVTLDISDLKKYSGQGKCREVRCGWDSALRYMGQLKHWVWFGSGKNWTVACDNDRQFTIVRMSDTEAAKYRQRLASKLAESDERERKMLQQHFFAAMLFIAIYYINFQPLILTILLIILLSVFGTKV